MGCDAGVGKRGSFRGPQLPPGEDSEMRATPLHLVPHPGTKPNRQVEDVFHEDHERVWRPVTNETALQILS